MPIEFHDTDDGVTRVTVTGRIDVAGAHDIDLPMSVIGGSRRAVVVDLSGVDFMASLGLRTLVMTAKAVTRKTGKIVLLNPIAQVEEVIRTTGVDELIPIFHDDAAAVAAVRPG